MNSRQKHFLNSIYCFATINLLAISCTTQYTIHIKTIPPGTYDLFFDKNPYGHTPPSGDTIFQTSKISIFRSPELKVKNDCSSAMGKIIYGSDSISGKNIHCAVRKKGKYDITFILDSSVLIDTRKNKKDSSSILAPILTEISSGNICYCLYDPTLLEDKRNTIYSDIFNTKHMDQYVSDCMIESSYLWKQVDSDLIHRITLGIANSTENTIDSLPYAAWDLAMSQKIDYLVLFYGYSFLQHDGADPAMIATTLGLSALSVLTSGITGSWTVGVATGHKTIFSLDIYCSIIAIQKNRCVYTTKASKMTRNSQDIAENERAIYKEIFANLKPFFRKKIP